MNCYAKVIVKGSPITKSNFKLFNSKGRAILPINSGKSHDKYALYEEEIAYEAKVQNPNLVLKESLIAILKVYYKSEKRHPDTNNITKSIFDGIEKSGLIINDIQIRRIIIEEFYDKENPRFELELFGESSYKISYNIVKHSNAQNKILYDKPANRKKEPKAKASKTHNENSVNKETLKISCSICNKFVSNGEYVSANKGKTIICRQCLLKTF